MKTDTYIRKHKHKYNNIRNHEYIFIIFYESLFH